MSPRVLLDQSRELFRRSIIEAEHSESKAKLHNDQAATGALLVIAEVLVGAGRREGDDTDQALATVTEALKTGDLMKMVDPLAGHTP